MQVYVIDKQTDQNEAKFMLKMFKPVYAYWTLLFGIVPNKCTTALLEPTKKIVLFIAQ